MDMRTQVNAAHTSTGIAKRVIAMVEKSGVVDFFSFTDENGKMRTMIKPRGGKGSKPWDDRFQLQGSYGPGAQYDDVVDDMDWLGFF